MFDSSSPLTNHIRPERAIAHDVAEANPLIRVSSSPELHDLYSADITANGGIVALDVSAISNLVLH